MFFDEGNEGRRVVSYHMAGHALMIHSSEHWNVGYSGINIDSKDGRQGIVRKYRNYWPANSISRCFSRNKAEIRTARMIELMDIHYGGVVAEKLVFGCEISYQKGRAGKRDYRKIDDIVKELVTKNTSLDAHKLKAESRARCESLLAHHRCELDHLADALLHRGTIWRFEFTDLI